MNRFLIVSLAVTAAGAGMYLGLAQGAGSATDSPRVITLRNQDVAVFRGVQCVANVEAGHGHFLCSGRPRSKAKYDVAIFPASVVVYKLGRPDQPLFATP
jgi:hypothetical protein